MINSLYEGTELKGLLARKRELNRNYLLSLKEENLLLPFQLEAGRRRITYMPKDMHDGWDSPLSQIRGTVCGHWLSAVSQFNEDAQLQLMANRIIKEISLCQEDNGGEWCFPIPEKYLLWLKKGKNTWAPHYVCHKVLMGLLDMYRYGKNEQALSIIENVVPWFLRYIKDITPEKMIEIMWEETGALMEFWADLYAVTNNPDHLKLMRFYERSELFDLLEAGENPLMNMHANTTIPEIHGAARAYEVTGEKRYLSLARAYWKLSVEEAVPFATGGQSSGEVWTPPGRHSSRLGPMTQEHCTVYNMMRLAEYLFRQTGESKYMDYWEKNLYNGILAQGYWEEFACGQLGKNELEPKHGYVAYYLPLHAGAKKAWGSATGDFWCCHCTLLQANAYFSHGIYFRQQDRIYVSQYFDSNLSFKVDGTDITIEQTRDNEGGSTIRIFPVTREHCERPEYQKMVFNIKAERPVKFQLALRIPSWITSPIEVLIDGEAAKTASNEKGFIILEEEWLEQSVTVILPKGITTYPLPDMQNTVAFLDGPVVLAGLVNEERTLYYRESPEDLLIPDNERMWENWLSGYRTAGQPVNFKLRPLYDIFDETYTTYFPVEKCKS